jgi:hypothetical protein
MILYYHINNEKNYNNHIFIAYYFISDFYNSIRKQNNYSYFIIKIIINYIFNNYYLLKIN